MDLHRSTGTTEGDMPEVKWVEQGDFIDGSDFSEFSELRKNCTVPVLTLDQIEEWLKREKRGPFSASEWLADKLLAQVQAMKEGA